MLDNPERKDVHGLLLVASFGCALLTSLMRLLTFYVVCQCFRGRFGEDFSSFLSADVSDSQRLTLSSFQQTKKAPDPAVWGFRGSHESQVPFWMSGGA